jgi:hypothetical protein
VDYVMQRDHSTLLQAVQHLAKLCGLEREFAGLANFFAQINLQEFHQKPAEQLVVRVLQAFFSSNSQQYKYNRLKSNLESFATKMFMPEFAGITAKGATGRINTSYQTYVGRP